MIGEKKPPFGSVDEALVVPLVVAGFCQFLSAIARHSSDVRNNICHPDYLCEAQFVQPPYERMSGQTGRSGPLVPDRFLMLTGRLGFTASLAYRELGPLAGQLQERHPQLRVLTLAAKSMHWRALARHSLGSPAIGYSSCFGHGRSWSNRPTRRSPSQRSIVLKSRSCLAYLTAA